MSEELKEDKLAEIVIDFNEIRGQESTDRDWETDNF